MQSLNDLKVFSIYENINFNRLAWNLWRELKLSQPAITDKCSVWYDAALWVHIQKATFEMKSLYLNILKEQVLLSHAFTVYTLPYTTTGIMPQHIIYSKKQNSFHFPSDFPSRVLVWLTRVAHTHSSPAPKIKNRFPLWEISITHASKINNWDLNLTVPCIFFFSNQSSQWSDSSVGWLCSSWTFIWVQHRQSSVLSFNELS